MSDKLLLSFDENVNINFSFRMWNDVAMATLSKGKSPASCARNEASEIFKEKQTV